MRVIAGLGNPGRKYKLSRHNLGFMVVEECARLYKVRFFYPKFRGRVAKIRIGYEEVLLSKPHTYMNNSGESVAMVLDRLNLYPDQLIVIHDDLDLPLGKIKLGFNLGSAGHKGVQSIIEHLGSQEFYRVRCGIGKPASKDEVVDYVLSPFKPDELEKVKKMISTACKATEVLIKEGLEEARNIFHRSD